MQASHTIHLDAESSRIQNVHSMAAGIA